MPSSRGVASDRQDPRRRGPSQVGGLRVSEPVPHLCEHAAIAPQGAVLGIAGTAVDVGAQEHFHMIAHRVGNERAREMIPMHHFHDGEDLRLQCIVEPQLADAGRHSRSRKMTQDWADFLEAMRSEGIQPGKFGKAAGFLFPFFELDRS